MSIGVSPPCHRQAFWRSTNVLHSESIMKEREKSMSTTTIRLPENLKKRIAQAAEQAGTSSHAFILEAIANSVEAAERRNDFHEVAERRYAEIAASGKTIPWSEMRTYLLDRVSGKKTARPRPKKLAR